MAILPQGHQLHQFAHSQHGRSAMPLPLHLFKFLSLCVFLLTVILSLLRPSCPRCAQRSIAASSRGWRHTTRSSCKQAKAQRCSEMTRRKPSRGILRRPRTITKPWSSNYLLTVSSDSHSAPVSLCYIAASSFLISSTSYSGQ